MGTDEKKKQAKPGIVERGANAVRVAVPTLVGGLVTLVTENPLVGAAAAVATRGLTESDVAERVAVHVGERLGVFTKSTQKALPPSFNPTAENPHFDHAVYQNYRRAMDAIDVAVIPALGRMTALYYDRPTDRFFRGVGHILEGLTADEFNTFRRLLSGVVATGEDIVEVTPQGSPGGMKALLWTRVPPKKRQSWVVEGLDGEETIRCLRLLDRNDVVMENRFHRDDAQALEAIFGALPVELDDRHGAATAF